MSSLPRLDTNPISSLFSRPLKKMLVVSLTFVTLIYNCSGGVAGCEDLSGVHS